MDSPFQKKKREEIGLDMTPGRLTIPKTQQPKDIDLLEMKGGGGKLFHLPKGFLSSSTSPDSQGGSSSEAAKMTAVPKVAVVVKPEGGAAKAANNHATGGAKSEKPERYIFSAPRKCIVKVDTRAYNKKGTGAQEMVTARLAPFLKETGSTAGAKVGYITREEALEGSLFTVEGNHLEACSTGKAINQLKMGDTTTIILSPEDDGADLVELSKRFMKDIYNAHSEHEPRFWCAAVHGNTKHKHVHIIVSLDGKNPGEDAKMDLKYIKSGRLQEDVSDILTEIQGGRSWAETLRAEKKQKKKFLTAFQDAWLAAKVEMQPDGTAIYRSSSVPSKKKADMLSKRLYTLQKGRYVQYVDNKEDRSKNYWLFRKGAIAELTRTDYANFFGLTNKEMDEMVFDNVYSKPYEGTIIETTMRDDKSMLFMIREVPSGKIHLRQEWLQKDETPEKFEEMEHITLEALINRDGFTHTRIKGR